MSENIFKKGVLFTILVTFILLAPSCKKEPRIEPGIDDKKLVKINTWVTEEMRFWYYWNKTIPTNGSLTFNLEPEVFFKTILNENDRYSWIDKAENLKDGLAGVSTATGLNIGVVRDGNIVIGYVRYVIPKSPADLAGIERGMFFTKVNEKRMTVADYNTILDPYHKGVGFSIQLAELEGNVFKETTKVDLASAKISEPAVYLYNTLTTESGKKVGYLFYNRFLSDTDDRVHSDDLFEAFQYFKGNGVQDLILDLRYNLGGSINVSALLSALIMQNYNENKVYVEYQWNDDLNDLFGSAYRFKNLFSKFPVWNERIPTTNLNLPRVFVLATYNSASASEMVINNLRPYMDVLHIGKTTRGKNEGSITIKDERKNIDEDERIEWAMQPIVLKIANADHFGDYHEGLPPTIESDEGYLLRPLGDKNDPLVKAALEQIDPSMATTGRISTYSVLNMLEEVKGFDEMNNKARPVLIDETLDKEGLRREIK